MMAKIEIKNKEGDVIMTLTRVNNGYNYTTPSNEKIINCKIEQTKKGYWVNVYLMGLGRHKFFISNVEAIVTE